MSNYIELNIDKLNKSNNESINLFFKNSHYDKPIFLSYWEDITPYGSVEYINCVFFAYNRNSKSFSFIYFEQNYSSDEIKFTNVNELYDGTKKRITKEYKMTIEEYIELLKLKEKISYFE